MGATLPSGPAPSSHPLPALWGTFQCELLAWLWPSPPTPGLGATLLLQACLLDVSLPGWARALNFAWPMDAKGVLLGTPFGSRQDVLAAGATSPALEQSGTMRPCGQAGFAGGTSMEGPLPAKTQWLKVTGHPLLGEAKDQPLLSCVCQRVTLLPLPTWFSLGRDELCPQPVFSWAGQVGAGAERAWEQHAWACRAPASSPLPPEWEGSPQQSLAQLGCSSLVFTEQLQCLQ